MSEYTKIVNYAAKDALLEGNPNKIIKGTELDAEFVAIQNAVETKADLLSPTLTGVPRAPTAAFGTNTTQIATTAFVQQNGVPIGGILMWSGIIATIPQGYALCDGTEGTPDLRDRFIVGAGTTYTPATTGGAASVTLLEANIPAHSHAFGSLALSNDGSHTHTVTDPEHSHTSAKGGFLTPVGGTGSYAGGGSGGNVSVTSTASTGLSINAGGTHSHTLSGSTATTGSGTAVSTLPPYFALAFIMRTA